MRQQRVHNAATPDQLTCMPKQMPKEREDSDVVVWGRDSDSESHQWATTEVYDVWVHGDFSRRPT